ncbi:hypothetical protein [Streptomyces endophyticus]|uniref:Uncharacterized protein n=1 Tax=Streptomyces endophyticus TaxID=714166 RepID=A0ABU6EWS8_9ACTN|nr:hypothetical protein [Streptomyces endophyticus]MEB8336203.1 hypothetical protein [Streptomyces endophyticus]
MGYISCRINRQRGTKGYCGQSVGSYGTCSGSIRNLPYRDRLSGGRAFRSHGAGSHRRWAGILLWLAIDLAGLMVIAFVVSFVFLAKVDADVDNAAYGYLPADR